MTLKRLWYHSEACRNSVHCRVVKFTPLWAMWGFNLGNRRVFGARRGWANGRVYPAYMKSLDGTFVFLPFTPWGIAWRVR
jgi:hypothetical protein